MLTATDHITLHLTIPSSVYYSESKTSLILSFIAAWNSGNIAGRCSISSLGKFTALHRVRAIYQDDRCTITTPLSSILSAMSKKQPNISREITEVDWKAVCSNKAIKVFWLAKWRLVSLFPISWYNTAAIHPGVHIKTYIVTIQFILDSNSKLHKDNRAQQLKLEAKTVLF